MIAKRVAENVTCFAIRSSTLYLISLDVEQHGVTISSQLAFNMHNIICLKNEALSGERELLTAVRNGVMPARSGLSPFGT